MIIVFKQLLFWNLVRSRSLVTFHHNVTFSLICFFIPCLIPSEITFRNSCASVLDNVLEWFLSKTFLLSILSILWKPYCLDSGHPGLIFQFFPTFYCIFQHISWEISSTLCSNSSISFSYFCHQLFCLWEHLPTLW